MKKVFLIVACASILMSSSLYAYDARLLSLNNPTLSHTAAVPAAEFPNLIFPTDEFGFGISAVPDTLDIWKFPQALVDQDLFPSHTVILDYLSPTESSGGIVLGIGKIPLAIGVFLMRPNQNGWVIGRPRSDFPNLGFDYATDAGNAIDIDGIPPDAPINLVDLMVAGRLGIFRIGAGVGYSCYNTWDFAGETIGGIPGSEIKEDYRCSVVTARLGASVGLNLIFPLSIDLGALLLFSTYNAEYISGPAAVPLPDVNASVMANNLGYSIGGRITWSLRSNLDLLLLQEYVNLPQDYEATDNSGNPLDSTTTRIDSALFESVTGGLGVNWAPLDNMFMNALLTFTWGSGSFYEEAPG